MRTSVTETSLSAYRALQMDGQIQPKEKQVLAAFGGQGTTAGNRTITFILGNRDGVNEVQSKVLLGAEGYLTRHDWALHFVSFRSDLNAPLSSVRLPDVLTQSNRPGGATGL